ncbi:hybrid sensor histidine kinase/response regulator [Pseudoduganella violacea]|uniref:histidine kinase n=1 Tax=Pseudoduganella violacea TaxID=1715466 RepID=A0A7W5FUD8_9BURK|nr:signal transduction histidine kinase/ligand-binding sensor domain-containing protein/CheY-like chemotaxis protein [Pseudoduganella violacea]
MLLPFRRYCRQLLLPALLALAGGLLTDAQAGPPPRTLRFEQLNVDDGLAQESVLAIMQDRQGFMWFGSQAGLSRYDGYRTVVFRHAVSDPHSLAENWVKALHLDPIGRLWVGTDGGLDRYDPVTQKFSHYLPDEPVKRGNGNRHVGAIIDDGIGALWVGTSDGLQHFDPASGRFTIYHHEPKEAGSLMSDQVNALARDAAGRLWVGTAAGVDMLMPGAKRFRHFPLQVGKNGRGESVISLHVDSKQTLWVGSVSGVEQWKLDGDGVPHRRRMGLAEGLPPGPVPAIYQDSEGTLWVGTQRHGLFRWRPEDDRFVQYRHQLSDPHSLSDNYVSSLFRDRVGTLWVGTWYAGVSRVDLGSGGFARLVKDPDRPRSLSDNRVRAVLDAGNGKLWLGNNDGLNYFDPVSGETILYRLASLADSVVTAMWRDPQGMLWVGGRTGMRRFDPVTRQFSSLLFSRGDPDSDHLRYIYGDRSGVLWISSRGGLHRYDPASGGTQTFRHDPADGNSLADNIVRPVLEDSRGSLWVGTFNGLDLLDRKTGQFRHFRHDPADPSSLSHDEVHYLYEDAGGVLWVGTAGGLNRMEFGADGNVKFRRYLRKDGLADDAIAAILADDANNLWLSTNTGLSRLNIVTGQIRNYSGTDGTIEGAYFDGSALRAPDGNMYFGGFNGLTAFAPKEVKENSIAPTVAITDFQVFNKSVRPGQSENGGMLRNAIEYTNAVTLQESDTMFSLEFTALHYAAPKRNRFAYQLQGFDRDWVVTDASKRFATYTNLDPGTYTFRVKAANKDGIWNDNAATLEITILPPFWKTWWFRSLIVLTLLGSAVITYQARVRGLRRQRTRLEQQVSLRTAEVELKNKLLQQQKRELEQRDERLSYAKQKAEDATRQKSEFLANMSHEMRTPLAGVIGMLGFALRDSHLAEGTREQIERGQANAQSLLTIINDLLDFSKIEAGKLTIENIDFALAGTVENVVSLFEEQAAAHSVGFAVEFGKGLPPFVVGDPTRLRQVLVNLVGNAFKFTQRGHVSLRVERLPESVLREGRACSQIRFTVEDTGIGIPAEAMPRLFQKFEQADSTTTRRYGGTGLGLAICRQLVELMGGEIGAVSTPGIGSVFAFTLPLPDGVAPPLVPHIPREPHSHQLRVLCAEDFPTNQIIIRMMLEDLGHKVDIVGNGALAVAACAHARYDLILMDGRMPEMDGPSATRLIRSGGSDAAPVRDQELMIIALTANASEEDRSRYLASGMDDFLTKPIDEAALHFQLSRAIERQLQRGILLPEMPLHSPPGPSAAELDAMFGVSTEPEHIVLPRGAPASPPRVLAREMLDRRLLDAFLADLPERLAELDAAIAAADADAAGRLFHGLKGSAGYLELSELQALAGELERAADRALWAAVTAKLPRLRELLQQLAAGGVRTN